MAYTCKEYTFKFLPVLNRQSREEDLCEITNLLYSYRYAFANTYNEGQQEEKLLTTLVLVIYQQQKSFSWRKNDPIRLRTNKADMST